jgi:hypothetical protein
MMPPAAGYPLRPQSNSRLLCGVCVVPAARRRDANNSKALFPVPYAVFMKTAHRYVVNLNLMTGTANRLINARGRGHAMGCPH